MKYIKKFSAFTLAEVLIVLGIIGIIAEITIPTLVQRTQEKQTVVALKKNYSVISNAYNLAIQENGTPENWNLIAQNSSDGAKNFLNTLVPYLKILKNCQVSDGCWINQNYLTLSKIGWETNIFSDPGSAKAVLADGTDIAVLITNPSCSASYGTTANLQTVCADIWVDINGEKKPNQDGVDLFLFWATKTGIYPFGTTSDTQSSFDTSCNRTKTQQENGVGCAAWVLYNENMDYLRCDDLSWTGKTKCD